MRKLPLIISTLIAAVSILATNSFAQETATQGFGNRLSARPYIGVGAFIPKEGQIDIGMGTTLGFEIASEKEAIFIDATFSQTGKDASILWSSGDVRQTVLNLGYKTNFGKWGKWMLGASLQSHRMDFGNRRMSALTVAALAEYKLGNKTSLQFISTQLDRKSDVRFGVFQLNVVRYF